MSGGFRTLRTSEVERELRRQGWRIVNGGSHRKAYPPGGLKPGQLPLVLSYGSNSAEKLPMRVRRNLRSFGPIGHSILLALGDQPPAAR